MRLFGNIITFELEILSIWLRTSKKALMKTWILAKLNSYSTSRSKAMVCFMFCNIFYKINLPCLCKLWNQIGSIFESFNKYIVLPKMSFSNRWPFKGDRLFNFNCLTKSHCNIFWATNTMEFVRTIFQSLFEGYHLF